MYSRVLTLFICLFLIFCVIKPTYAGDVEDGIKALEGKNYKTAIQLFSRAAEQGDANAQYNLGVMYDKGQGVSRNYKEAAKWLTLAADHGSAEAKCTLAGMYARGDGVGKNTFRANQLAKEGFIAGEDHCKEVWDKYELANK